jgi:type IV pilus assembly protein PilA
MLHLFWRRLRRDERGFTLIELLIVIAIIAILAAILIPNFLRARRQSLVSATKGNLKNIATALESYFVDNNQYPGGLADLATGSKYIRAVPPLPVGGAYGYKTASGSPANQDYVVCDNATDTITVSGSPTTWYYMPGGGLASAPGANTVSVTYTDGTGDNCP